MNIPTADLDIDPFSISVIDGEKGFVHFNCGWCAPITNMIDEDGEDTDDKDEAVVVVCQVPDGYITIDLRELIETAVDEDEYYH